MLTLADVLVPVQGVVSRDSVGELVIVLPEKGKFLVLNATGAEVFRLVDGQRTIEEIAALLSERFDISLDRARADVLSLAGKLVDRGAIERRTASPRSPT